MEGEYQVKRAKSVKMEYWSPERLVREFSGKLGLIVQHERDHLDGITIDQIGSRLDQIEGAGGSDLRGAGGSDLRGQRAQISKSE